jgi:hypothetical protein
MMYYNTLRQNMAKIKLQEKREEVEDRQYGGGDRHSLSYEQLSDLGLHQDESSVVEEVGGDGEA